MTTTLTIDGAATALVDVLAQHVGKPVLAFGDAQTAAILAGFAELGEPPPRCYTFRLRNRPWFGTRRVRDMARVIGSRVTTVTVPTESVADDLPRIIDAARTTRPEAIQIAHVLWYAIAEVEADEHGALVSPRGPRQVLDRVAVASLSEVGGVVEVSYPWEEGDLAGVHTNAAVVAEALGAPGPYVASPAALSGLRGAHQELLGSSMNTARASSLTALYGSLLNG